MGLRDHMFKVRDLSRTCNDPLYTRVLNDTFRYTTKRIIISLNKTGDETTTNVGLFTTAKSKKDSKHCFAVVNIPLP